MDVAQSMQKAIATAYYLQNWLPTTTLSSQTPFEKWSGIKPDLPHLKIFGSTTYSYVLNATRNKLEDRAIKQIFIDCNDHFSKKGCHFYNSKYFKIINNKIIKKGEG